MRTIALVVALVLIPSAAMARQHPAMTPEFREELATVQADVNQSIRYVSDMTQYGVSEKWVTDPESGAGDCEDYALTKRLRLAARGVPVTAMAVRSVVLWNGEGHAVLVVHTSEGDMVLDNRVRKVMGWDAWARTALPRH